MKRLPLLAGFALVSLALFGAGCSKKINDGPITVDDLQTKPPQEITNTLQFLPGDSFVLTNGLQINTTLTRFAPTNFAELFWATEVHGVAASGTISSINLSRSHTLYPPALWRLKTSTDLQKEKTALWLSDDAYMELSRTKRTVLNFGVLDETMSSFVKSRKDLKPTFDLLRSKAAEDGKRVDLTLVQADDVLIDWPLKVNGKEITVKAIRARNWFGEVVVLDNRQNPMVLQLTLRPLFAGADEAIKENDSLKLLFNYRVTGFVLSSIK